MCLKLRSKINSQLLLLDGSLLYCWQAKAQLRVDVSVSSLQHFFCSFFLTPIFISCSRRLKLLWQNICMSTSGILTTSLNFPYIEWRCLIGNCPRTQTDKLEGKGDAGADCCKLNCLVGVQRNKAKFCDNWLKCFQLAECFPIRFNWQPLSWAHWIDANANASLNFQPLCHKSHLQPITVSLRHFHSTVPDQQKLICRKAAFNWVPCGDFSTRLESMAGN